MIPLKVLLFFPISTVNFGTICNCQQLDAKLPGAIFKMVDLSD